MVLLRLNASTVRVMPMCIGVNVIVTRPRPLPSMVVVAESLFIPEAFFVVTSLQVKVQGVPFLFSKKTSSVGFRAACRR